MGKDDAKRFEKEAEFLEDDAAQFIDEARKIEESLTFDRDPDAQSDALKARDKAEKARRDADESREKAADEWRKAGEPDKANEVWEKAAKLQKERAKKQTEAAKASEDEADDLEGFAATQRRRADEKRAEADKLDGEGKAKEAAEARELADTLDIEAVRAEEELAPDARRRADAEREKASDELAKAAEDLEKAGKFKEAAETWEEAGDLAVDTAVGKKLKELVDPEDFDRRKKKQDKRWKKALDLYDAAGNAVRAGELRKKTGEFKEDDDPEPDERKPPPIVLPGNIAAADAYRILAFINSVESAEALAEAIEIPGRPDVGVRVSARILNERARIGEFVSLEQVDAVPQVGPARFSDIVATLSSVPGIEPPQDPECPDAQPIGGPGPDVYKAFVEAMGLRSSIIVAERRLGTRGTPTFAPDDTIHQLVTATPHQGAGSARTTAQGNKPNITQGQAERIAQQTAEKAARSKAECELRMQQDNVAYPSDYLKVRGELQTTLTKSGRTIDIIAHKDGTTSYTAIAVAEGTTFVGGKQIG